MNNIYLKILTGISILGAILVSFGYEFQTNVLWSICDPLLAYHNFKLNQKEQGYLFVIFTLAAWIYTIQIIINEVYNI